MSKRRHLSARSARPRSRRLGLETLEHRRVLAGMPLGADVTDTAEFMLGRVAVTPVFFESTGAASTQDWTAEEIDGVLQKIQDSTQWWADTLDTLGSVHHLEFVFDDTYARTPVSTSYEPINEISNTHTNYVASFLNARGVDNTLSLQDAVRVFNNHQRQDLQTDWGVTIFVVDASGDSDGMFKNGGSFLSAFAYAGGAYMVAPSTRPASVFAHELGHLFWTQDEYTDGDSWSEHRGYYDTLNLNAADNPTPGFVQEISIMAGGTYRSYAYQNHYSPASTLALVGWRDSDRDGVFDVLDVPLELEGVGKYNPDTQQLEFTGAARAVALPNRNPEGLGNDITLNRISRVEYSVDGAAWLTAATPDLQVAEVSFTAAVSPGFDSIQIRAIDAATGVISPAITLTATTPGATPAAASAYVFLDRDGDQTAEAGEAAIEGLVARVVSMSGGDLPPAATLSAPQYAAGASLENLSGVELTAGAIYSDGRVSVNSDPGDTVGNRFSWYKATTGQWIDRWSPYEGLDARLEEPTTRVSVSIAAADAGAIGRLEAYDSVGNLLDRDTSVRLNSQQSAVLEVQDPDNRIARIRVWGHSGTEILITQLIYGPEFTVTSDANGILRWENLPDGTYQLEMTPPLVIHEVVGPQSVTVAGGSSANQSVGLRRIASPWQNPAESTDIDANQRLEPLDALTVINYLNRYGSGPLPPIPQDAPFLDADGDGIAAPVDVLLVVNELNRRARENEQGGGQGDQAAGWIGRSYVQETHQAEPPGATPAVLAVDRIMSGNFPDEYLASGNASQAPKVLDVSGYAGSEEPEAEKPEDPLNPFFSEPLRSEGF